MIILDLQKAIRFVPTQRTAYPCFVHHRRSFSSIKQIEGYDLSELFSIYTPRQNRTQILIRGKWTFSFLIFVGSNPQVQLEKCIS
jgi:hypothetical protein